MQHLQTGLTPRLKELSALCTSGAEAVGEACAAGDAAARCGVYVLELENGKFYVGSEEDMERRIEKHKSKTCECMLLAQGVTRRARLTRARSASQWTQQHAYVSTVSMRAVPAKELPKEELGTSPPT